MKIVNLFDYEQLAQASIEPAIWDYFHGGSGDEVTLRENREALALGARAVLIGRPAIWGLAINGTEGVQQILELLRNELEVAMTLAGCSNVDMIDHSLLYHS